MNIQTFVFLDCETTGLPAFEANQTKITELSLISAQAEHIALGVLPRVQNKITLCFNPRRRIQPRSEIVSGLDNMDLVNEKPFDEASVDLLNSFLDRLKKPICFVAHNGLRFDYPILRNHIEHARKPLLDDILCIDSLCAFHDLTSKVEIPVKKSDEVEVSKETNQICNEEINIESLISSPKSSVEAQILNETTPPVKKQCNIPAAPRHHRIQNTVTNLHKAVQRRLDFDEKPKSSRQSFKLGDIYKRLTNKSPENAHQAEVDVKMLMECAVHFEENFIEYANKNAIPFNNIPKMEVGVRIGTKA